MFPHNPGLILHLSGRYAPHPFLVDSLVHIDEVAGLTCLREFLLAVGRAGKICERFLHFLSPKNFAVNRFFALLLVFFCTFICFRGGGVSGHCLFLVQRGVCGNAK